MPATIYDVTYTTPAGKTKVSRQQPVSGLKTVESFREWLDANPGSLGKGATIVNVVKVDDPADVVKATAGRPPLPKGVKDLVAAADAAPAAGSGPSPAPSAPAAK